jgi:RNA polymerase sigma-70 factor (ECF subfamily)
LTDAEPLTSAELFKKHAPFVAKFLLRMGAPRSDLDDLMQEVFLIAHRNGGYQPGPAKPTTYLASIAFRLVHTERRKRRVRSFVELNEERVGHATSGGDPERDSLQKEQLRRLDRALDQLDAEKRAVLVLADIQGDTVVSIASALGINLDTAYSRLRAARRQFREALEEDVNRLPSRPSTPEVASQ